MADRTQNHEEQTVRTLFLSDLHLGTRSCRADLILSFLKKYKAETLYLAGDIIDGWALKRRWFWPAEHDNVLKALIQMAKNGTRIIYTPGNHDDFLRSWCGRSFAKIELAEKAIHKTADGRRLLVLHGDQFDKVTKTAPIISRIGDVGYDFLLAVNRIQGHARKFLGLKDWSLSAFIKHKFKQVVNFISEYEDVLVAEAKSGRADGIVCGHIHHAAISDMQGITYINTGDWVESCTAITESYDGSINLINYLQGTSSAFEPAFPQIRRPEFLETLEGSAGFCPTSFAAGK